jgi:hypothetical protein
MVAAVTTVTLVGNELLVVACGCLSTLFWNMGRNKKRHMHDMTCSY